MVYGNQSPRNTASIQVIGQITGALSKGVAKNRNGLNRHKIFANLSWCRHSPMAK